MTPADGTALPETVDAVLLDAGGVLLDLDYPYLRRLIDAKGQDVSESELSRAEAEARREVNRTLRAGDRPGDKWRDYFRIMLGRAGISAPTHDSIIDSLWSAHERVGLWTAPADGAAQAVAELQERGFRMGVVSNAEGQVARDLENAGFGGIFETVVDSALVGVEKPDPAIFEIALERMKLDRERTVFVGDLPAVDVVGAQAAGLCAVLIDRHDIHTDQTVPRLRSLAELPSILSSDSA